MADIRTPGYDPRREAGVGRPISAERAGRLSAVTAEFPSFEKGIDLRDVQQDMDPAVTNESTNIEITDAGYLRRAPGHETSETMSGRVIRAMLLQTSLDFTTELLMFDGEYLGVKSSGATVWTDVNFPAGDAWVGVSNLEKILLSNGTTGIYTRDFGVNSVALVSNSPAAVSLANFAGRVWALGPTYPASTYQALGIGWSADAEGLFWTGLGSGAQLLIADTSTDDRGIALRPLSFDLLVVLCQRSIWIGRPTGDLYEPAIFEPRVQGVGCVAEPTAVLTPIGVIFLSESGVRVFDGNAEQLLSAPINAQLLPVLTNVTEQYSAVYDSVLSRYMLFTPECVWIYEIKQNRWLRWGFTITRAVTFSEQFSGLTWGNVLATWESVSAAWEDFSATVGQLRVVYAKEEKLGVPSYDADTFIDGSSAEAQYEFLRRDTVDVNSMFETQRVRLRYQGAGDVDIRLPDVNGSFVAVSTKSLPSVDHQDGVELGLRYTGRGLGAQLRWSDTSLELSKAQIVGMMRGHRQGVL